MLFNTFNTPIGVVRLLTAPCRSGKEQKHNVKEDSIHISHDIRVCRPAGSRGPCRWHRG